jgi:hypothetical protein
MSLAARILLALVLGCLIGACQSTSLGGKAPDAGGDGHGPVDDGPAPACFLQPAGTFTFHVHNAGTNRLSWFLGCSKTLPIVLHVGPGEDEPAGPGSVDSCEFTCDRVYQSLSSPGGCTDCGAGYVGSVAPGNVTDIVWDRRGYVRHTIDDECSPGHGGQTCALGLSVTPSIAQTGTITVCDGDFFEVSTCVQTGTSTPLPERTLPFTVDTTGADGTIDVM